MIPPGFYAEKMQKLVNRTGWAVHNRSVYGGTQAVVNWVPNDLFHVVCVTHSLLHREKR